MRIQALLRPLSAALLSVFLAMGCDSTTGSNGEAVEDDPGSGGATGPGSSRDPGGSGGRTSGSGGSSATGGSKGSGGSSSTSSVSYKLAPPTVDDNVKSGCDGGTGFICPRFMLFSPEMEQAASDDAKDNGWPQGSFHYGVVTLDGQPCCSCWQIVYGSPTDLKASVPTPKPLIAQMFNTGAAGNADIFMGKGGMGAFTSGCPALYASYPDTGEPWMGGVRATNMSECGDGSSLSSSTCTAAVSSACNQIQGRSTAVTTTTRASCVESNQYDSLYHENWNVEVKQVECPTHLTEVTGCMPNAGSLGKADPTLQDASQTTGSGWASKTSTSMQDCCKPSCAWSGKSSNTKTDFGAFYTCDNQGNPMID